MVGGREGGGRCSCSFLPLPVIQFTSLLYCPVIVIIISCYCYCVCVQVQCQELVSALMQCSPHYVRCIKSNDSKRPLTIDPARVQHQSKYLGLNENIKVVVLTVMVLLVLLVVVLLVK